MMKLFLNSKISHKTNHVPIANTKGIALISMLIALSVTGRILFSFIPNVQPTTPIIIITTLLLGVRFGMINAVLSIFLSNLILGTGMWTVPQIISLSVVVLITGFIIRPISTKTPHILLSLYAGISGMIYGFIISLTQAPVFGIEYFWAYYLYGLPFDLAHAAGNVAFYYLLAPVIIPLLERLLNKYFLKKAVSFES